MTDRPTTARLSIRIGIAMAVLLGLGLTVPLLAGRAAAPRQGRPDVAATADTAGSTAPATASSAPSPPAAPAPPDPPPTAQEADRRVVPPSQPRTPARTAPVTGRGASGALAEAWIAAGARGIDPGATPAPAAIAGRGGPAPVRIEIAAINVAAPVDPAGKNGDGTLEVPTDFARTSYYTGRPVPGDPGPAVIIGHVDGRRGPAVFHRLRELRPGTEVRVQRADGTVVAFVVERSKQVPKNAFPTDEVYGPTPDPTLRLITCGGSFDRRTGHYRDNTIVFLRLKA